MRRSFVSDCGGGSNRLLKLLAQAKSSKLVALVSVGLPLLLLLVASHQPVDCARVAANLPASGNGGGGVAAQQVANSQPTSQQQASNAAAAASQISTSGAQLFQSPAALAAIAAAAAAQQANLPVQHPPPPPPAAAAAAMVPMAAQQVSAPAIASNMLSPSLPAAITGRVDTAELLKQAAQQLQVSSQQQQASLNIETECLASGGFISFELITGYVLSAPAESMIMQPGTLQLTDCLNLCRQNSSCLAINFETGLCVLLQESADKNPQALQKSQFPVFTIYAHKICISGDRANRCHKSWSFERVIGWVLNNLEKKTLLTKTRLECLLACYNEQSFQCKSFNYDSASGSCQLSDMDRHSLPSAALRRRHYVESSVDTIDYGENNCIQEARGICDFKPLANRILKTVDSIYQDIKSEPECRKRCLQAPYRCHSYDLGDSSNPVCRTSHLDRNSLQQIQDPYLDIQGAVSYELDSCYNVTVTCKSREMVARIRTNKVFNGKIYAKNAPLSCLNDITNSMDFELTMAFNDACAIQRSTNNGVFSNEIVLQHNDMIVTNSDMGLNVKCQYDLRNQTVYNNINLDDFMAGREPIDIASQSAVVRSPNISMQILAHDGQAIKQAQVGDALMLRFQITDDRSPFEIFVRDLYAMDGVGGTEIMLIDGEGCPTDPSIMAAMSNAKGNGQTLEAQFDAFKFPTSETVAFRGLVTPCIPHCEPVHCQNRVYDGTVYEAESFGKRRRRRRRRSVGGGGGVSGYSGAGAMDLAQATGGAISAGNGNAAAAGHGSNGGGDGSGSGNGSGNNVNGNINGNGKRIGAPEEVVLRNSIEIRDKFFEDSNEKEARVGGAGAGEKDFGPRESYNLDLGTDSLSQTSGPRVGSAALTNGLLKFSGLILLFGGMLAAQTALLVFWALSKSGSRATSGKQQQQQQQQQQHQQQQQQHYRGRQ